jgi:hypothetical protein
LRRLEEEFGWNGFSRTIEIAPREALASADEDAESDFARTNE